MRIHINWAACLALLIASTPYQAANAGDRVAACGGLDQRACCFDEAIPSCDGDNVETTESGGTCGGPITGFFGAQAGMCRLNLQNPNNRSECGGDGQRACCIGEAMPSCDTGLLEANPASGPKPMCPNSTLEAGICFAPTACGAPGQRACCTTEKGAGTPACNDDAAPIDGGIGDHEFCGDATSAFLGLVPGATCVAVTECGGVGQRACCSLPAETLALGKATCGEGVENLGVTGDATCTDNIATTGESSGICIVSSEDLPPLVEPTTNWSPATTVPLPAGSLRGYADMHLHLLGHMAHGKQILAGYPAPVLANGYINPNGTPSAAVAFSAGDDIAKHGLPPHLPIVGDTVGFGTNDSTLSNFGWPYFNGWPSWNSTTHQQVYYKWLERAWRGGLRVATMLAVTNEAMCKSNNEYGTPTYEACSTSMTSIIEQLQTAWDFQAFIDNQSGGAGQGWFRIVGTPEEARNVIRAGKLAVILGIEVDNLFGCKESGCPEVAQTDASGNVIYDKDGNPVLGPMDLDAEVEKIYQLGVRHVFPVHNFDNAFGAAATWQDTIGVGQAVSEGRYWKVENCRAQGYGFSINSLLSLITAGLGFDTRALPSLDLPLNVGSGGATCNKYGLYSNRVPYDQRLGSRGYGPELINALMDRGILIDIDHMSNKALDETIAIAKQRWAEYPLLASHVQFFERHVQDFEAAAPDELGGGRAGRHERMRTPAQLAAIRAGGGMIAAMLKDDVQDTGKAGKRMTIAYGLPQKGPTVPNNCVHSSKSFAQSYQYAVDMMDGPVAFGSDFNGIAGHIGPRFGSEGCAGMFDNPFRDDERLAQEAEKNRVPYPFELPGFGTLHRQVTGLKTFDYNTDGMAHVGMLPDFVKDLQQVGLSDEYMDAVFCSAERYLQVWDRARAIGTGDEGDPLPDYSNMSCRLNSSGDRTPPVSTGAVAPAPNGAGWNKAAATVTVTAADEAGGSGLEMIAYTATGASSFADSSPSSPVSFPVVNDGVTSVSHYARDVAGNSETAKSLQVRIDKVVPTIEGSRSPAANAAGWNNAGVTASFTCTDALSGIATCSLPQSFTVDGQGFSAAGTATDRAGNEATTTVSGINIDKTVPTISGSAAPASNAAGWNNTNVTVSYVCADALSGVASCTAPATLGAEGAGQSTVGTVVDNAGNSAIATVSGISIDKTVPTISGAAAPAANAAGWNNTNVTVTFTCTDALSGVASCTEPATLSTEGVGQTAAGIAVDTAGNQASTTVLGIKIDKTRPAVSVTNVTQGAVYIFGSVPAASCSTTDTLSGVATPATIAVTGGTANGVGTFTATCSGATDVAGNSNSAQVTYSVHYDFRGFFSPVDAFPTANAVTAGQAVPFKFTIGGDFGLDILAPNSPVSVSMVCLASGVLDDVEETVAASASGLMYSNGQYIYVWKSAKAWANSCRQFQLKLDDGTTHSANFKFR